MGGDGGRDMVFGYARMEDGDTRSVDSVSSLKAALDDKPRVMWLDYESGDAETLAEIGRLLDLHGDPIEDCLVGEQRPRIDDYDDYLFMVVYGAVGPEPEPKFSPRKLSLFFNDKMLLTVHTEPLTTINAARNRCRRRPDHFLDRGLDMVFYNLIDEVVDNYLVVAESLNDRLDELEDKSTEHELGAEVLAESSHLRRELVELRRIAVSLRELLQPFASGEYNFISDRLDVRFSHVRDHITKTIEIVDGLRDLLNGVRDNYHAALSQRMNEVMRTLTIFASLFLPLTLLAGIYGMNTPLWPPPDSILTFWAIIGTMVLVTTVMLVVFWLRKWF